MLSRIGNWLLQKNKLVIGLALLAAAISRIYLVLGKIHSINSDDAIIGIMARHILNGAKPLFYYGQLYYGPLDAYLSAPLFALFGSNNLVLRIVPVTASILFVYAAYLLGRKFYSETTGLMAALFAVICPPYMLIRSVAGGAVYILLLLLGTFSLILFEDIREKPRLIKWIGLALLLLVGIWVFPLMMYYVAAMGLAWLIQSKIMRPHIIKSQPRVSVVGIVGILAALFIIILLLAKIETFYWVRAVTSLSGILKFTIPIMFGLSRTVEIDDRPEFLAVSDQEPIQWIAALICVLILAACAKVELDRFQAGKNLLFIFASVTILIYSIFFIFMGVTPKVFQDPRFLFPLYSAIPLFANTFLHLTKKRPWIRFGAVVLICSVNIFGLFQIPVLQSKVSKMIDWYQAHPMNRMVYTDYWIGYELAFESQEQIIPFIITDQNTPGTNRYPPYQELVSTSQHPSFIYTAGSPGEEDFLAFMKANRIDFQASTIDMYSVYWGFSAQVSVQPDGLATP